jgi:hypothetical protein
MGIGLPKVVAKSVGKALRDFGVTVGVGAAVAALTLAGDATVLAPVATALGPWGAILLLVGPIAAKTGLDAIKHRDKA